MRMAKQRRKYERLLDVARGSWHEHRAEIEVAKVEKAETIKTVRAVRDSHASTLRPDPYGRRGATRMYCVYCTTNAHPCPTWKSLNALLDRLLGRTG